MTDILKIKVNDEWVAIPALKGDKGATGNGVLKTEKTSTSGLVDTYTMTYTNGNTFDFTVTNGQDGTGAVLSVNGETGDVILDASDVGALPDNTVIPTDTSDLTNGAGFITGITSTDVTTALGFTPYSANNPAGYTSNVGTVTSVNNVGPVSGNVTLSIPSQASDIGAQETLVSGTNIKTINNTSLLGSGDITISSAPDIDGTTITKNTDDELQTVAVIDNRSGNATKLWTGTAAQLPSTRDANTLYHITDDTDLTLTLLEAMYPVGSIYIGTMQTCPLQSLGIGTWQLVANDRVLQGAGTRGAVGSTVNESLPNITGNFTSDQWQGITCSGSFSLGDVSSGRDSSDNNGNIRRSVDFSASRSSSTYQNDAPVQQDAYLVNIWERVS